MLLLQTIVWMIQQFLKMLLAGAVCASTCACSDPAPPSTQSPSTAPTTLPSFNREIEANLKRHVTALAGEIGERNTKNPAAYLRAREYIEAQLKQLGFTPARHEYSSDGQAFANIIATIPGGAAKEQIIIVGAHYDSAVGTPGANDNASGVAASLELARLLRDHKPAKTIRIVFFANEEPPHFRAASMGSQAYARKCFDAKEKISAMISLETIGYFDDAPGSQRYPEQIKDRYPSSGHFIGVVSDVDRKAFVDDFTARFKAATTFPAESAAMPPLWPGIGWSDHWAFWQFDYPALMVTDTAPFRYPHYHKPTDTPDKLMYDRMAMVVEGVEKVVRALAE